MKHRIVTNSIRTIRRSFLRFLSLAVMSMLGVFAFSGLQATSPDMIRTLDVYLDQAYTYDIQVVSTMGISSDDIEQIKKCASVQDVQGAYIQDAMTTINDKESVVRIQSVPETINRLTVIQGTLPVGENEIVVEEKLLDYPGRLVIGPAGENKVLYACVFSNERTAGRGGVGAVFGDKRLKAVTAKGTKLPKLYREEKLKPFNAKWTKLLQAHPLTGRQLPKLGTAGLVAPMQAHSILATKNFSAGRFDNFEMVSGEELAENHLVSNGACTTCVIRCARRVEVEGKVVKGPELETLGLLGPNILNDDIEKILKWNYELDELGMDAISCAGSVAFAMELAEKGVHDFGIHFGETDNISKMFEDIAYRRGEGNELADGSKRMSDKFGGKEYAIHAKGMELAAYEPRHAVGQGLGYATSNRGGCHLNAGYMVVVEGLGLDVDSLTPHGKAALAIMFQNLMESVSAAGSCLFTSYAVLPGFLIGKPNMFVTKAVLACFPYVGPVVNLLSHFTKVPQINIPLLPHPIAVQHATGMKANMASMLTWGAYGWNAERIGNVILGQKAGADKLPKRLTEELQDPNNPKTKVPLEKMKKVFYRARGWKDGVPTWHRLKTLGIDIDKAVYDKAVAAAFKKD